MNHTHAIRCTLAALFLTLTGTAAIGQLCTREYLPVCGLLPDVPAPRTFPNRCVLEAAGARLIAHGVCAAASVPALGGDTDGHGCKASAGFQWNEELSSCVRPWLSRAVTLQVGPQRQVCSGVIETQCLQVRELVPGQPLLKWTPLFGEIAGFTHAPGKPITLRVRKDKIESPPADASDTTYTLLKVLP